MKTRTRVERPASLDYLADVRRRFGHMGMVNLAALGTTGTDQRKPYQVVNRVAVIYVQGLLSNDAYYWDETDYSDIQNEFSMAADDVDVDGVLQICNTPGGYTDLCFETAELIATVAKKKPVYGVASPIAYSAGYALLSQSTKIFVPKLTGGVGSVGVYCAHFDYSDFLKQNGIKVTLISKGEGKTDGNQFQPLSDQALKNEEAEMDRLYSIFVGFVSSGRGLTESQVKKLGAYCYQGSQESLGVGLSDVAGTPEDALAALVANIQATKKSFSSAAAKATANSNKEVSTIMVDPTQPAAGAQQPDAAALAAARKEGRDEAQAETQEINTLCQIAGKPALAAGFLAEKKTPAQVREALVKAKAEEGEEGGEVNNHTTTTSASPDKAEAGAMKKNMEGTLKRMGLA